MSRSAQDLAAQAVIGDKGIGGKPEMAVIADILADGERFFGTVPGIYGKGNGILAATDRRLIFAYKSLVGSTTVEEFPYARIDAIKHKTGMLMGEISVGKTKIDHVVKRLMPSFVRGIQAAMSGEEPTPDTQDVTAAPAPAEHKQAPKVQAASGKKRRWPKIALIVGAVLVGLYMLGSGRQPASVPAPAQQERVAAVTPRGLGVSRATLVALLGPSGAGYPLASAGRIGGQDRWMGQAGTGIAEIVGPANNVTNVSVIGGMAKGDMNNNFKHLIDMRHLMEAMLPDWPEGKKRITDSIPKVVDGQAQSVTRGASASP